MQPRQLLLSSAVTLLLAMAAIMSYPHLVAQGESSAVLSSVMVTAVAGMFLTAALIIAAVLRRLAS